jgi:hypothetical protein
MPPELVNTMKDDVTRKISALASRPKLLSESEVSHLMTLCRKYLEHIPQDRERYSILKFFCDWALHIALDGSLPGLEILRRLNDTLVEVAPVPDSDLITVRLTGVVSFRRLRREMGTLFLQIDVPDPLDEDQERWVNFARHLIEIIRDCPLEIGDEENMSRRAGELYEAIKANPLKNGCWVVGVAVVAVDYGQFLKGGRNEICLHVLSSDTTHLIVPMAASEIFGPPC